MNRINATAELRFKKKRLQDILPRKAALSLHLRKDVSLLRVIEMLLLKRRNKSIEDA